MAGGPICIRNDEQGEGDTVSDLSVREHWPSINPWGHTPSPGSLSRESLPDYHPLNDP